AAIQAGLKDATMVPLETLAACVDVLELSTEILAKGNPNVISDGGAGVLAAHAGMMTAALNVQINLNAIQDEEFKREYESRMRDLLQRGEAAREKAWALVRDRLGM
ncbi:MAG: methenyltetrahydrofolate cyclohydrolase, partial [Caldilineae bacterium]